tara:strand:- start:52 stop:339 length:288 start_codon:yes stop_codon:yes gene_type:complete
MEKLIEYLTSNKIFAICSEACVIITEEYNKVDNLNGKTIDEVFADLTPLLDSNQFNIKIPPTSRRYPDEVIMISKAYTIDDNAQAVADKLKSFSK